MVARLHNKVPAIGILAFDLSTEVLNNVYSIAPRAMCAQPEAGSLAQSIYISSIRVYPLSGEIVTKFHTSDKRLRRNFPRLTALNEESSCSINEDADWRSQRGRERKREYSERIGANRCGLSETLLAESEMESFYTLRVLPKQKEREREMERKRKPCSNNKSFCAIFLSKFLK